MACCQNGFWKGRNCMEHIFSLTTILQQRLKCKKSTFACFIDAKKVFDRVDRSLLWLKLSRIRFHGRIVDAVKSLYSHVNSAVRINGYHTDWFPVDLGVKQGCLLSPLLFAIFINDLADQIKQLGLGLPYGDDTLSILLYADDIVLLADTEQDM